MRVSASAPNVDAMLLKLDILMNLYPWVDMVLFSELCAYGPLTTHARPVPGEFAHCFANANTPEEWRALQAEARG